MKYLTLAEILQPCVGQNWAVGAYDTCNLEITQAIVDASAADQAPAIIMIYPHHTPQAEWPTLLRIIEAEVERAHIPAALVLDHAKTLDQIEYALELGFSGVMIDASLAPLEQNIALTRRAVELAHASGASVEAELGHVGDGDDVISPDQQQAHLTRVDEAKRLCEGNRRGCARRLDWYAARAVSRQTQARFRADCPVARRLPDTAGAAWRIGYPGPGYSTRHRNRDRQDQYLDRCAHPLSAEHKRNAGWPHRKDRSA